MRFLPRERFVLDTPEAPDEVRERLLASVEPPQRFRRSNRDKPFTGTVEYDSFELRPVLSRGYVNSFAPIAEGTFASGVTGTRVEVRLRLSRGVAAFMGVWLSGVLAFVAVAVVVSFAHPSDFWFPLFALALFAGGYGLMTIGFSVEARRVRGNLERLLVDRVPAPDLRPGDISWLFDFRLVGAEPAERTFNRVFLAVYAIAAGLSVFTWDRTASACSNMQHGSDYHCPSGSRIVLTWALIAILIATGFASRFALHRRARRLYPPLLFVVAAIAVTALWLLTHRDHWGMPR